MVEHDSVDDGEFVYRRIHRVFFDPTAAVPIQPPAFRPNANDTTGLSVFRALFVQPTDTLADTDPSKAANYYIARLRVQDLRQLALTVVPEPLANGPRGHAVIPELNWHAYRTNKPRWKGTLAQLAKLASAYIVHRPGGG